MKIGIYINGSENGLDTASAGEGRFAYNLAHMFAIYGNEVIALGSDGTGRTPPKWGSQSPIKNVRLAYFTEMFSNQFDAIVNLPHDINMNGGWVKCTDAPQMNAKNVCHNSFSWSHHVENHYVNINK